MTDLMPTLEEREQIAAEFWKGREHNGVPLMWSDMSSDEQAKCVAAWNEKRIARMVPPPPLAKEASPMMSAQERQQFENDLFDGIVALVDSRMARLAIDPNGAKTMESRIEMVHARLDAMSAKIAERHPGDTRAVSAHVSALDRYTQELRGQIMELQAQVAELKAGR